MFYNEFIIKYINYINYINYTNRTNYINYNYINYNYTTKLLYITTGCYNILFILT
jgi:hypothetical protein